MSSAPKQRKSITLYDAGKVEHCDRIPDGLTVRIARRFLVKLLSNVSKQARNYFVNYNEDNFLRFQERNLYSQFAAAIHSMTGGLHVSEESINRFAKQSSSKGRVDFWAYYEGVNVLLEIKRQYFSINKGLDTRQIQRSMESLASQTKSLKREATGWGRNGEKSVLVGLQVLLPYLIRGTMAKLEKSIEEKSSLKDADKFRRDLVGRRLGPNFVATWIPPIEMTIFEREGGKHEYNPFIGFAAYVVTL